jgi:hypothetical protein
MSNCAICGRALRNPASIARGVGPICAGRSYLSRIASRFGASYGWSDPESWAKANCPCFKCLSFVFPDKGEEKNLKDGSRVVTMNVDGQEHSAQFPPDAIGGYCSRLKKIVDGLTLGDAQSCEGKLYARRWDNGQVGEGTFVERDGQLRTFDFETGLSRPGERPARAPRRGKDKDPGAADLPALPFQLN